MHLGCIIKKKKKKQQAQRRFSSAEKKAVKHSEPPLDRFCKLALAYCAVWRRMMCHYSRDVSHRAQARAHINRQTSGKRRKKEKEGEREC